VILDGFVGSGDGACMCAKGCELQDDIQDQRIAA
jgi:hypothetical protein